MKRQKRKAESGKAGTEKFNRKERREHIDQSGKRESRKLKFFNHRGTEGTEAERKDGKFNRKERRERKDQMLKAESREHKEKGWNF